MNFSKGFLFVFIALLFGLISVGLPILDSTVGMIFYIAGSIGFFISLLVVLLNTSYSSDLSKEELARQKSQKK